MKIIFLFTTLFSLLYVQSSTAQSQINWISEGAIDLASQGNNHPRVVADREGNPLVIWFNSKFVMFSKWNTSGFESPRILSPVTMSVAGASWMGPDIAAHGDTIYVVFKEAPEEIGHIWCIHSYDGGEIFSDPVRVDYTADSLSRFPTVTTDGSGNPVIGFMKFDPGFSRARWAVTRSDDFGNSFLPDVLASGWSSPSSVVCDCCPGSIVCSGDNVVMLYRDNNNNIRDTWAGFSSDGGLSFTTGLNIDQHNWLIHACPSSGPDGVIIGDSMYTTFMSAASGMSRVYSNRIALPAVSASAGSLLTGSISGLFNQNFPRISAYANSIAEVWKQNINGNDQCVINFTADISSGLPSSYDTVTESGVNNTDIAIGNGNIIVVWEDYNSGTVKFRWGTYSISTATEPVNNEPFYVFPNPSNTVWTLKGDDLVSGSQIDVMDVNGKLVYSGIIKDQFPGFTQEIKNATWSPGVYYLRIAHHDRVQTIKLVKF